jgi:hypothetical protein
MLTKTRSSLLNALLYQVGWFACVLGAAAGWGSLGASLAIALAVVHLWLAESPGKEWPLMLAATGVGIVVESIHAALGVLEFQGYEVGTIAPLWIVVLWLQFATTLHFSLGWLSQRYRLAFVFGLIGGPLAFLGGERLGAATLGEPRMLSIGIIGLVWALAMPILVRFADRLGGRGLYRGLAGRLKTAADLGAGVAGG